MKKVIVSLLLILGALNVLNAQDDLETCTPSHDKAFRRVVFYLKNSQFVDERIKAGTTNISIDQISHVDDPQECLKITELLKAHPKFKGVLLEPKNTLFYYQSDDFYYVTLTRVEMILGTSSIFIIINKLTEETYSCYL